MGHVLDAGFEVLKFRFLTVLLLSCGVVGPLVVVPTVLARVRSNDILESQLSAAGSGNFFMRFGSVTQGGGAWTWVLVVAEPFAIALVGVGVAFLVSEWLLGRDPSPAAALRMVLRRSPVVLGAFLLLLPLRGLAALPCLLGLPFVVAYTLVVSPVVALEGVGPARAIGRSYRLVGKRFGATLGLVMASFVVTAVAQAALTALIALFQSTTPNSEVLNWVSGSVEVLTKLVLTPLHAAWATMQYFELRSRTEGLDMEVGIRERFGGVRR